MNATLGKSAQQAASIGRPYLCMIGGENGKNRKDRYAVDSVGEIEWTFLQVLSAGGFGFVCDNLVG